MRARYLAVVLFLLLSASAQNNNTGEQLYQRAMDAVSGSGPSRNDLEAIDYFKRSAELGYIPAQVAVGFFYDTGTLLPGSDSQAAEWYRKAADKGDPLAQWLLGSGRATAPYVARQGTALGRAGEVHVSQDSSGLVWVGGGTVTCIGGTVAL